MLACACRDSPRPIAELSEAAGPALRQQGSAAWMPAQLGSPYFIGDAARTGDGTATLVVRGGGARILMQHHTVLRFGGTPGAGQIAVESGAVDLRGAGSYSLEFGHVKLARDGSVRITAKGNGRSSVELTIGQAQVAVQGRTFDLELGTSLDVGPDGPDSRAPTDAGVRDAPVAAVEVVDAAVEVVDAAVEDIPAYVDLRVVAGESLTIHDPRPPTAVQLQFEGRCASGGVIEVDRDPRFRTARVSRGRDFASVRMSAGAWSYRLRCTGNGAEGGAVASGRIVVLRDAGHRSLPKNQGVNEIDADGRNYRISYQSAIPRVLVRVRSPGAVNRLHLASRGRQQVFESRTAAITVPGAQLREGTYTYWVDRDGVKQDKVSTLTIDFDQTAPQVYIESPSDRQPWAGDLDVRGAVLPGWSAAVGVITIPIDRHRRFAARVGVPSGSALAIRLSHPQRGVHYYLRRPR